MEPEGIASLRTGKIRGVAADRKLQRPPTPKAACVTSRSIATCRSDHDSRGWGSVRAEDGLVEPRVLRSPTGENRSAVADCGTTRPPMPKSACVTSRSIATRRSGGDSRGWRSVRAEDGVAEPRALRSQRGNSYPAARRRCCTTTRQDIWVLQSNSPHQDMCPGLVHRVCLLAEDDLTDLSRRTNARTDLWQFSAMSRGSQPRTLLVSR